MTELNYDDISVGDELESITKKPISRHTLALYCGGSGDHNPLHVDTDFAKRSGFDDVIAHGMLSMSYLAQLLIGWASQEQLRSFGVRFAAMTHIHDEVTCSAKVTEKFEEEGEKRVRLDVATHTQSGAQTLKGTAVIAFP